MAKKKRAGANLFQLPCSKNKNIARTILGPPSAKQHSGLYRTFVDLNAVHPRTKRGKMLR